MPDNNKRSDKKNKTEENAPGILGHRSIRPIFKTLNNLIGQASLDLYGTDRKSQVAELDKSFDRILRDEVDAFSGKSGDNPEYLSKLSFEDGRKSSMVDMLTRQLEEDNGQNASLQAFIEEAYKNKLLEQSDLHEIASQLIELGEAILITRDAILSPDIVTGRLNRNLEFEYLDKTSAEQDYIPLIVKMETRLKLQEIIRNFVVPRTLEYGEFYVYTIPYSKIFSDFSAEISRGGGPNQNGSNMLRESSQTLLEFVSDDKNQAALYETVFNESAPIKPSTSMNGYVRTGIQKAPTQTFAEKVYNEYVDALSKQGKTPQKSGSTSDDKKTFCKDINNMMERVSVSNCSLPLPVLEEGSSAISYLMEEYYGSGVTTEADTKPKNRFYQVISGATKDGVVFNDKDGGRKNSKDDSFKEFTDCYIKMLSPIQIIPVKIVSKVIGYYYIQTEDVTPLAGDTASNLAFSYNSNVKQKTIIDSIAGAIVASFDKKFLRENEKFKEMIVEAITYYNLNEKRIKFQFIPVDYVQVFKIEEDENGEGTSMIKKSLFYAKLYLMLLLFKIMSIIMNSNDTKVNYIKSSGINKDISNKIQEIARIRQSRQINIYDLFNYTTLVNKVGAGSELYIPTGRSGERPIETEILSGQDVQLNTDLLEMLKNAYILGTGVPAALINYMNEADFAKVVEQNNSKFLGRVVNYQASFNSAITEWYKKIMAWTGTIPPEHIDHFKFTLQQPKSQNSTARSDAISNFQSYSDFAVSIIYGDNNDGEVSQDEILRFKRILAEDQLPNLNITHLLDCKDQAEKEAAQNELKPNPNNGDNGGDDIGLEDDFG